MQAQHNAMCVLSRYLRLKWLAGFQIHINSAIVHTLGFFRLVPRGTQVYGFILHCPDMYSRAFCVHLIR